MKYLPWVLAGLLAVALIWALVGGSATESVGIVNLMRVVDESTRAQEYNQRLSDRYEELIDRFSLDAEPTEDDVDRANRERQAYSEYLALRQELETQLQREVDAVVQDVAQRMNITVVIDDDVIRYGGKDITDEVIGELN